MSNDTKWLGPLVVLERVLEGGEVTREVTYELVAKAMINEIHVNEEMTRRAKIIYTWIIPVDEAKLAC